MSHFCFCRRGVAVMLLLPPLDSATATPPLQPSPSPSSLSSMSSEVEKGRNGDFLPDKESSLIVVVVIYICCHIVVVAVVLFLSARRIMEMFGSLNIREDGARACGTSAKKLSELFFLALVCCFVRRRPEVNEIETTCGWSQQQHTRRTLLFDYCRLSLPAPVWSVVIGHSARFGEFYILQLRPAADLLLPETSERASEQANQNNRNHNR